jgi:hypothetical protein
MISAENRAELPVALVDSLLSAIVRVDGDALVLHAGERPYVVGPSGQSQLASRELTLEAMTGMLNELLPADARDTLDELGAVQRELAPAERRPKIQLGLAEALRGVVAQVLLRKIGGGRVAAREVLLNTSSVAALIAEGKTSQLPMAIDSGRKHGMVPLNDALSSFVQSGVVDSRSVRQASDQAGFWLLKRQGIDASCVERLA